MAETCPRLSPRGLPGRVGFREYPVFGQPGACLDRVSRSPEESRAEGEVGRDALVEEGSRIVDAAGPAVEDEGGQPPEFPAVTEQEVHALPRVKEKGEPTGKGEGELELERLPLPPEVFIVPDPLRPVAVKVEPGFPDEGYPPVGRQPGQVLLRISPHRLGMDAETGHRQGELRAQFLRSLELGDVMGDDGAAPVRRGKGGEQLCITREEVDEVQVGVAVHGFIVATPGMAVNGRRISGIGSSARKKTKNQKKRL